VEVTALEKTAITDSSGYFAIPDIRDGNYELTARYPYFAPCSLEVILRRGHLRRAVDVTLTQLMRFWVEPCSLVVSLSEIDGPQIILDLWCYAENISDRTVVTRCAYGPVKMIAVKPADGIASDRCHDLYGRLMAGDFAVATSYRFDSGAVGKFRLCRGLGKSCFPAATYDIFWAVCDESDHPERLRYSYYGELNQSLYGKRNLFRTASLIVVD
jgi:hypothetical protein